MCSMTSYFYVYQPQTHTNTFQNDSYMNLYALTHAQLIEIIKSQDNEIKRYKSSNKYLIIYYSL